MPNELTEEEKVRLGEAKKRIGEKLPDTFEEEYGVTEDSPIEDWEAAEEIWDELLPEERSAYFGEEVEWRKRAEEEEREEEGQKKRFIEYIETGRDPLELKKLEEEQEKRSQEEKYDKLLSKALALGIPASKIPPIEHVDLLEDLVQRKEREQRLKEKTAKEQLSKERWKKRAAIGVAVGAGIHTAGKLAGGARRAVVPPRAGVSRIQEVYFGKAAPSMYGAPGMRYLTAPPRPVTTTPPLIYKGWGSPFGQLMTRPGIKPTFKSPLVQMVLPRIRPGVSTRPTPTTERIPMVTKETLPTAQLQEYMRQKGVEPIEQLRMPAYFFIGTKRGVESSDDAWVVQLETGRYGIVGTGKVTGQPRMKISWGSPEAAFDAASEIPGNGKYPVIG